MIMQATRNCPGVVVSILVCALGCTTESSESPSARVYDAEGFELLLPDGVDVTRATPAPDFELLTFSYRGTTVLSAYVGNFPSVGKWLLEDDPDEDQEYVYAVRSDSRRSAAGAMSREAVVSFGSRKQEWPEYVHFWYRESPAERAGVADTIIARFQPAKGKRAPDASARKTGQVE